MGYFTTCIKGHDIEFTYGIEPPERPSFWSPGYEAQIFDIDWDDTIYNSVINDHIANHLDDIKDEIIKSLQ